jgi:hypothetical protein
MIRIAGSGKTYLGCVILFHQFRDFRVLTISISAAIVNELQTDPQVPVLYWYFTFREGPTQHCDNFVRSLLTQLLSHFERVPVALEALYQHHINDLTRPSLEELTACLVSILNTLPAVRLVGEGFDECIEWGDLSKVVSTLLSGHCPTLQFIFTSRPEGNIADALNTLNIPSVNVKSPEDVKMHLKHVVHTDPRFTRISHDGKTLIWEKLGEMSEGR